MLSLCWVIVPAANPASSALLMLSMFVGDVPEDCNKGERELIKLNREEREITIVINLIMEWREIKWLLVMF